jgi:hypothetical protein
MRLTKTSRLIIFAVSLSAIIIFVGYLRTAGYVTLKTQQLAAYLVFLLNVMIAIKGAWINFRLAWILYLAFSITLMLFVSAPTPFTAVWTLFRVLLDIIVL